MKVLMAVAAAAVVFQTGAWRASTGTDLALTERGDTLHIVNTGNVSVDLWRADARPLAPPYIVRATLRKLAGRTHESYGLFFGGRHLGTDSAQYGYVMIRGDGGVLLKKRDGATYTLVSDWRVAAAETRDDAEQRATNRLEIRVTAQEVVALINGTQVARVPASDMPTAGVAGVRLSHHLRVDAVEFRAGR